MKVIASLVVLVFLVGCASINIKREYQEWSAEDTPAIWTENRTWVVALLDDQGAIIRSLTLRFTAERAKTCSSGDWLVAEVLSERPPRDPGFEGVAAYRVAGAMLTIDLSANLCDNYYPLRGRLSETGVIGTHGSVTPQGSEYVGPFVGAPIGD